MQARFYPEESFFLLAIHSDMSAQPNVYFELAKKILKLLNFNVDSVCSIWSCCILIAYFKRFIQSPSNITNFKDFNDTSLNFLFWYSSLWCITNVKFHRELAQEKSLLRLYLTFLQMKTLTARNNKRFHLFSKITWYDFRAEIVMNRIEDFLRQIKHPSV